MTTTNKQLVSGITYTAVSKYTGIVISLIVTAILARLISPEDFGIVAVATVIIAFFNMFSDLGIAPAIVQKSLVKEELSDIFSFTIWIAVIISGCFFFSSWSIAAYYETSQLVTICQLLSIDLFFAAINIVPYALLMKNKEFKFLAYRSLLIQTIGGTISIFAAFSGAGLYALIINPIFTSVILFLFCFKKYPQKLKMTIGLPSIRKIYSFSSYQFLFIVINYFSRNSDKLIIGKYLGLSSLGYYEKSYRLMMLPLQNITHIFTPVMHPVFSELQNDLKQMSGSYLKLVRFLAFLGFSLSVLLWFSASELVLLFFGPQWEKSIPVFRILTLTVGTQIISSTSGAIFQAANDTKNLFFCGVFSAILIISGIVCGVFIFSTIEAVAWGISISFFIGFIQCYYVMYKYTFRLSLFHFWKQLGSPVVLSLLLIALFASASPFFEKMNLFLSLAFKGILWLFTSCLYVQYTGEYDIFGKIRSTVSLFKKFKHIQK